VARVHGESHRVGRSAWLRAAVLGANDGLISTSSLIMGVAAAQLADSTVFLAGLAGLVGGALSMAAGEYVSVSSQADSEAADLARERLELAQFPEAEHRELVGIYSNAG
jgi:VIT1/CCC1 family predicted Fe2+/Mn2+ transporter